MEQDQKEQVGGRGMTWRQKAVALGFTVAAGASPALAGTPPEMPPIQMPIAVASVVGAAVVIGGTILLAWAGPKIGFTLAKALVNKASQIVRT